MTRLHRLGGMIAAVAIVAAACSSPSATGTEGATDPPGGSTVATTAASPDAPDGTDAPDTSATEGSTTAAPPVARSGDCPAPPEGIPWTSEVTATVETLQEPGPDTPGVQAVMYPRPDHPGRPWSQWGQGILLPDGRFLSAIGDHQGIDGNSYVYEYDPSTGTLTQIADAQTIAGHIPGEYGYGKIHAAMVPGPCGEVYTSTYWGTRRSLAYTENYTGDHLVRIDPESRTVASMGVLVPEHGAASMAAWPEGGLVYAEPADPFGQKTGAFVAYDAFTGEKTFETFDGAHDGYRTIAVDGQGRAYIGWNGGIARFDPATEEIEQVVSGGLPGGTFRASTGPDADGTIYGVTREQPTFFALETDGTVREIGPAHGYTSTMPIDPNGGRFFYIPGAHGSAWEMGASLIAVDTETGAEEMLIELDPLISEHFGVSVGGTYSISVDPTGKQFYIGLNAGDPASRDGTFGEIILAIVTLP